MGYAQGVGASNRGLLGRLPRQGPRQHNLCCLFLGELCMFGLRKRPPEEGLANPSEEAFIPRRFGFSKVTKLAMKCLPQASCRVQRL